MGYDLSVPGFASAESLLGYRFINLHRCLNEARQRLQKMGAGTAIVFSDSAFFRIETLSDAIQLAGTLMIGNPGTLCRKSLPSAAKAASVLLTVCTG